MRCIEHTGFATLVTMKKLYLIILIVSMSGCKEDSRQKPQNGYMDPVQLADEMDTEKLIDESEQSLDTVVF